MRVIGMDIHRAFAEVVVLEAGKLIRLGRVDMRRALLQAFAAQLRKDDEVSSKRPAMRQWLPR